MGNLKLTEKYVHKYGSEVKAEILTRLRGHGKYATGKLFKSVQYKVTETPATDLILSFQMLQYGLFVDKGVNGYDRGRGSPYSFKPKDGAGTGKRSEFIKSLMVWCRIKGLPKGAAFAIRENIWREGIAPTQFFTIPTTRRFKQFTKGVEKNLAADMNNLIQKDINDLGLNKNARQ